MSRDRLVRLGIGAGVGLGAAMLIGRAVEERKLGRIERSLDVPPATECFSEAEIDGLPEPARRYLRHAIEPEAPLARTVTLEMSGTVRASETRPWMPFSAREVLTPEQGFLWRFRARAGPVRVTGADHYSDGSGRMWVALFGLLPIVNATSPDITESAVGRAAAERVWLPTSLLPSRGVAWEQEDDTHAAATFAFEGRTVRLGLTIDPDGRLRRAVMERWGDQSGDGDYGYIPFGMVADDERRFDVYTIPSRVRAAWWLDSDRHDEFFRATIHSATFR